MGTASFFFPFHNISKYPPQSSYSAAEFMTKSALFWWGKIQTPCHGWMAEGTTHILWQWNAIVFHDIFQENGIQIRSRQYPVDPTKTSNGHIHFSQQISEPNNTCDSRSLSCIAYSQHINHATFPTVKSYLHQCYTNYVNNIHINLFLYFWPSLYATKRIQKAGSQSSGPMAPLPFERYPTSQGFLPQEWPWLKSFNGKKSVKNNIFFVGMSSGQITNGRK